MPKRRKPPAFYSPEALDPQHSVGWLAKRLLASISLQVDRRLAGMDLTHAQWIPLFRLSRGECRTPSELTRELQVDPGAVSRSLDRLEAKGLVRRVRSTEDRRAVRLELTEEGQQAAALVPPVLADALNAHLAGFTRAEWETLVGLLQRMVANGDALREARADDEA